MPTAFIRPKTLYFWGVFKPAKYTHYSKVDVPPL